MPKKPGDIIQIPLPSGGFAYAKVLKRPLVGFFDHFTDVPDEASAVTESPIAFKIWVMDNVVDSRAWRKIDHAHLSVEEQETPLFFSRDMVSKNLQIYDGHQMKPSNAEECRGLEVAAVWTLKWLESRLEHHRAGEIAPIMLRHNAMLDDDWGK